MDASNAEEIEGCEGCGLVIDCECVGPDCGACGGPGYRLGGLGNLTWFRCRDCGSEFSVEAKGVSDGSTATNARL